MGACSRGYLCAPHFEDVTDTPFDRAPPLVNDAPGFSPLGNGFSVVSILAAAMRGMDSVLLVAASTLYKKHRGTFRPSSGEPLMDRPAVNGFSIVAAPLAPPKPPGDIVEITIFPGSLYAVCFFPRSGFWGCLATRLSSHRPFLVKGPVWHLCLARLDCCWVAAGASRSFFPGLSTLTYYLPRGSRDPTASRRAVLGLTGGPLLAF
ncbi:MAG: hypothetical protein CM15mP84_10310 [Cellvibrionales bacterium]|nr:MAG: hypothetical protein CM15mP84_10310 [Cellvibrionales bacterium]